MKRVSVVLAVALIAASILSGCVIVPLEGWHGRGGYHRPYDPYAHPHPYYRGR